MILTSKHEIPRTDEEPQTNPSADGYVGAPRFISLGNILRDVGGRLAVPSMFITTQQRAGQAQPLQISMVAAKPDALTSQRVKKRRRVAALRNQARRG